MTPMKNVAAGIRLEESIMPWMADSVCAVPAPLT